MTPEQIDEQKRLELAMPEAVARAEKEEAELVSAEWQSMLGVEESKAEEYAVAYARRKEKEEVDELRRELELRSGVLKKQKKPSSSRRSRSRR